MFADCFLDYSARNRGEISALLPSHEIMMTRSHPERERVEIRLIHYPPLSE